MTPMTPQAFEAEMTELALAARGWAPMLDRLALEIDQAVALLGVHGDTVARSAESPRRSAPPGALAKLGTGTEHRDFVLDDSTTSTVLALRAGSRRVGYLTTAEPTTADQRRRMRRSHTALCIEAVRRDAEARARAENAARIIDEIRFGVVRDPNEVVRLAARFGVALDLPHTAAVFEYSGADQRTWATALSWIEAPVRADGATGWTVLPDDPRELDRILVRLRGMVDDPDAVRAASGSVVDDVRRTAQSFAEAEIALAFARRDRADGAVRFTELGLPALLVGAPAHQLAAFVSQTIGPIVDRKELLATLDAWVSCEGSRTAVAEQLHIHRNSVGYRLNRVAELTGLDATSFSGMHQLQSAMLCHQVLAIVRGSSPADHGVPVNPRPEPRHDERADDQESRT